MSQSHVCFEDTEAMETKRTQPSHAASDTAIMFISQTAHQSVLNRLYKLQTESRPRDEVFFAYDVTDADSRAISRAEAAAGGRWCPFESETLHITGYQYDWGDNTEPTLLPGNMDLLYVHLARQHPGYERYWFVEYDVAYTGDWATVFSAVDSSADVVGTTLQKHHQNPTWAWWQSFDPPSECNQEMWHRGFFPIIALSKAALRHIEQGVQSEWAGHSEAVIPSIAHYHGLKIADLGGEGPYASNKNRNRFYTNSPSNPTLAPGSFVYRPVRSQPGTQPETLWHPVKSDERLIKRLHRHAKQRLKHGLTTGMQRIYSNSVE